jgi:hypothetical protein
VARSKRSRAVTAPRRWHAPSQLAGGWGGTSVATSAGGVFWALFASRLRQIEGHQGRCPPPPPPRKREREHLRHTARTEPPPRPEARRGPPSRRARIRGLLLQQHHRSRASVTKIDEGGSSP